MQKILYILILLSPAIDLALLGSVITRKQMEYYQKFEEIGFKEKTGKNFVDYLIQIRMQKVKELLKNSDYKIIEICSMVGYDNPRSFSKAFKHYAGMTPKEYREHGK